jgi:TonB family protein
MKILFTNELVRFARSLALCGAAGAVLCGAGAVLAGPGGGTAERPVKDPPPGPAHFSAERTGVLETKDKLTLRLTTDLGSVHIVPLDPGAAPTVRYTVHIETDAHAPLAQRLLQSYSLRAKATPAGIEIVGALPSPALRNAASGAQFWVQYEVAVPAAFSVEVKTEGGDIDTVDIGGTAVLSTQGGTIHVGSIGVNWARSGSPGHQVARLETDGGHIQVQDVAGDLTAFTAGGHINTGNIAGDASLRTGGGHIRVSGQIGGRADLDTAGGNITVGGANSFVSVRTGGGQIDFGEVRGSVRAQTGGGGIRVLYVSGPMQVESSSGSICLTKVAGTVQASTREGTITAWINPDPPSSGGNVQLAGASQLSSGNGDLIVFLPRNLAATIEAVVTSGDVHRIEADPSLHLAVQPAQPNGSSAIRAVGTLNGGGAPLRLRTTGGKIRLQFLDSQTALRESLIHEQQERLRSVVPVSAASVTLRAQPQPLVAPDSSDAKSDWLESWINSLEVAVTGGLRENPTDFRKRLTYCPPPSYPSLSQRAGVQGIVKLQVRVLKDGRLEVQKLLEGEPSLADAAIATVKNWRAQPIWINGKPVEVISVVTFNFQLH